MRFKWSLLLSILFAAPAALSDNGNPPPNFVVIFTDELGDSGRTGSDQRPYWPA